MHRLKGLLICMSIVAIACKQNRITLPYFNTAELEPQWIQVTDPGYKDLHRIAPFVFLNQDSLFVSNKDFDGGIYVADFFFTTCPSICPKMTANMALLQDSFIDDDRIKLLSHTVTPWIDTVRQLKKYAIEQAVISDKWHLVTGAQDKIYSQARQSYFVEGRMGLQKGEDDFLHTENFVLVDQNRHIRGIYNGTNTKDIQRLIEDIYVLRKTLK